MRGQSLLQAYSLSNNWLNRSVLCSINPLNADLNPTCHLLALLGAHHILHISRIRVNVKDARTHKLCVFICYQLRPMYFIEVSFSSINQSINQPVNQSASQSANQSINQSVSQSISQSISQPISQSISKSINRSANQSIIQSINQSINSQPVGQSINK